MELWVYAMKKLMSLKYNSIMRRNIIINAKILSMSSQIIVIVFAVKLKR